MTDVKHTPSVSHVPFFESGQSLHSQTRPGRQKESVVGMLQNVIKHPSGVARVSARSRPNFQGAQGDPLKNWK